MILQSMTDYVLAEHKNYDGIETTQNNFDNIRILAHKRIVNYANFLKQPLKLGMFVPCDENGEPLNYQEIKQSVIEGTETWDVWNNAKERVLFEGFELIQSTQTIKIVKSNDGDINKTIGFGFSKHKDRNIESLVYLNLKLTDSAIKQINL